MQLNDCSKKIHAIDAGDPRSVPIYRVFNQKLIFTGSPVHFLLILMNICSVIIEMKSSKAQKEDYEQKEFS
jgi:hypothetical protein